MTANVDSITVSGVCQVDAISNVLLTMFGVLAVGGSVAVDQAIGKKQKEGGAHCTANYCLWHIVCRPHRCVSLPASLFPADVSLPAGCAKGVKRFNGIPFGGQHCPFRFPF